MNLISIIIPIYNVEKYLYRCINSVLSQSYKNIEVILINDGSTDGSLEICEEIKKRDDRVKVINQINSGVSSARNVGIENATGDYIAFIDSDDYIELDMLEILINNAINNDADISICGFYQKFIDGREISIFNSKRNKNLTSEEAIQGFFVDYYIKDLMYAPWNKLFKKEILKKVRFDTELRIGEDFLFVFKCLNFAKRIFIDDVCKYHYMIRENSAMTSEFSDKRFDYIEAVKRIEEICWKKYPQLYEESKLLTFKHMLLTCRKIILLKENKLKYEVQFDSLKSELRRKKLFKRLTLERKFDYIMVMYMPYMYKYIFGVKELINKVKLKELL